jgi:hypothetical protein
MRYCPASSVTTARTFSMSAGLDASTVTPGRTAPDVSLAAPAIDACARATVGTSTISKSASDASLRRVSMSTPRLRCSLPFTWDRT